MTERFRPVTAAILDELMTIVGSEGLSAAAADREHHARDQGFTRRAPPRWWCGRPRPSR